MNIELCKWDDISWIPSKYDTEYAVFGERKKTETWFVAIDKWEILGIGCLLHLNRTTVRHSNDFVIPQHRGKGVIKKLVVFREHWAKSNGFKKADVRTVKKYYEPLGYVKVRDYLVGGSWYIKDLS